MSNVNRPIKKYILWDNDGVLVDTEWWYFKATQRALAELGVVLEEQTYLQRMVLGKSSWDLAAAMGVDLDVDAEPVSSRDFSDASSVKSHFPLTWLCPLICGRFES